MVYTNSSYYGLRKKLTDERDNAILYNRKLRYNIDKGFTKAKTKAQKDAAIKSVEERTKRINEEYHSRMKEIEERILKLEKRASTSQLWDFQKGR